MAKKKLKFYDVKKKKKFVTNRYTLRTKRKNGRTTYFAVAKAPSGIEAWRIVSKEDYKKLK